ADSQAEQGRAGMFLQRAMVGGEPILIDLVVAGVDVDDDDLADVIPRLDLLTELAVINGLAAPVELFPAICSLWHDRASFLAHSSIEALSTPDDAGQPGGIAERAGGGSRIPAARRRLHAGPDRGVRRLQAPERGGRGGAAPAPVRVRAVLRHLTTDHGRQ